MRRDIERHLAWLFCCCGTDILRVHAAFDTPQQVRIEVQGDMFTRGFTIAGLQQVEVVPAILVEDIRNHRRAQYVLDLAPCHPGL